MRRSRFSEEQILKILREGDAGRKVEDLCRAYGVHKNTYYAWKAKFGGLQLDEAKRLRQLEEENLRLKHIVAEQALDIVALKAVVSKKVVTPTGRREVVGWLGDQHRLSERRACGLVGVARLTCRYVSRQPRATELQARLLHWAAEPPRFGYRRLFVLLRREGWTVNHKRVYRLYRAAGLAVRRRKRKRIAASQRQRLPIPMRPNERWSMDFMLDTLADGRTFRMLNVVDDFTRECVAIDVGRSIPGVRVVRVLERLRAVRGLPTVVVIDNGPEFAGRVLDSWAYSAGVQLQFIRPGKPVENALVESFNGKFRDECLNEHWFLNLAHAIATIEQWRLDYNTVRPHSSLGNRTPEQFATFSVGARRLLPPRADQTEKNSPLTEAPVT